MTKRGLGRWAAWVTALVALGVTGCGDDDVTMRPAADAAGGGDAGDMSSTDAGRGDDAARGDAGSEDAAGEDAAARDAGDAGMSCPPPPPEVPDMPSRQTVRFTFDGPSGSYVVTDGWLCGAYGIERVGGGALTLGIGFQCICECPNPGSAGPMRGVGLPATSALAVTWDARELSTYAVCVDCAMRGWPGAGLTSETHAAARPVEPGRYLATFGVLDEIPMGCRASAEGGFECSPPFGMGGPFPGPPAGYSLCPTGRTVSVELELPAEGDLDVVVPVPPPG